MPRVAPLSDIDPNCRVAPRVSTLKVLSQGLKSLDKNRAKGRAASGFRPKLQSRAESFKPESLVIRSEKSGQKSAKGRAASRFRPKLQICAECSSRESLDIRSEKCGNESRQGCAASGFGPKLHICAKSLSVESRFRI